MQYLRLVMLEYSATFKINHGVACCLPINTPLQCSAESYNNTKAEVRAQYAHFYAFKTMIRTSRLYGLTYVAKQ